MLKELQVVFDGPPGNEGGRFVEVECNGPSVGLGHWQSVSRFTGPTYWHLCFSAADVVRATGEADELVERAAERMEDYLVQLGVEGGEDETTRDVARTLSRVALRELREAPRG